MKLVYIYIDSKKIRVKVNAMNEIAFFETVSIALFERVFLFCYFFLFLSFFFSFFAAENL